MPFGQLGAGFGRLGLGVTGSGGNPFLSLAINGVGDSISQNTWEPKLATLTGRTVNSIASGGMTSTQVAARFGAVAIIVSVTSAQIPASGAVDVTSIAPLPININSSPQTMPCTLVGIPGTLARTDGGAPTNTYTFTRTTAGSVVSCPNGSTLIPTGIDYGAINIFWAGFNGSDGGHNPQGDAALMVAKCTGPYLVVSILNQGGSEYNASGAYAPNNAMQATYGDWSTGGNYVDVRQWLVDHYNPQIAQDVTDYGNGGTTSCVPSSLRYDFIHPDDDGRYLTAELLNRALIAKGWASDLSPGLDTLFTTTTMQSGVAATGVLIGATPGSTIVTNVSGLTVDSATRTFSGTPSLPAGGTVSNAWVETKVGTSGSPKSSPQDITQASTDPGIQVIIDNGGSLYIADAASVFSDISGTTPANVNDSVAYFAPTLGSYGNVTQSTSGKRPLFKTASGHTYLEADGTDDELFFSAAVFNGHTLHTIIVCGNLLGTEGVFLFQGYPSTYPVPQSQIGIFSNGRVPKATYDIDNGADGGAPSGAGAVDANPHVFTMRRASSTDRRLYVDNVNVGSNGNPDGSMTIDTMRFFAAWGSGDHGARIYGVAIVPAALSDSDRHLVETYLGTLAGLTV